MKSPTVTKITVITGDGMDTVSVECGSLPAATLFALEQPLTMKFQAAKGSGVSYVREHFGVEPNIITC